MTDARTRGIRMLSTTDAIAASAILLEAAAWSAANHATLWSPAEVSHETCETWARDGVLFGGFEGGELAAVFCVHDADALYWPDSATGDALYLHKIAVRRQSMGSGWLAHILTWSEAEAGRRQTPRLRLDTLAYSRLVGLYESFGFAIVYPEPLAIGGRVIERLERILPA